MVNRWRFASPLLAVLLAAGCSTTSFDKEQITISAGGDSASAAMDRPESKQSEAAKIPSGFRKYYRQAVTWLPCDGDVECATVDVPMDWSDPKSDVVPIALRRLPARGQARGSLLINPGGPGQSGTKFLGYARGIISESVLDAFDLVGFDPRGTGLSRPLECYDDTQWDDFLSLAYAPGLEGVNARIAQVAALGAACERAAGDWLRYLDVVSVARDMDMLRAVLGDEQINYLGYSYGSLIGSTYAGLFPANVGAMVLDGGIDPTLSAEQTAVDQARGFERALTTYVNYCLDRPECPLVGNADEAKAQIATLVEGLRDTPMTTSDSNRTLTSTLAAAGIEYSLYAESRWPILTSALTAALADNDGTQLLTSADTFNARAEDGAYTSRRGQAYQAISCMGPRITTTQPALSRLMDQMIDTAPSMGRMRIDSLVLCDGWPTSATAQSYDLSATGSATILVIGTTGDPTTPYEWSQSLTSLLDNAVLLTFDGQEHGAYGRSNACVATTVDAYLIENVIPATGATC
ncbi:alpha/beta hydrolase [Rarobacter faecitabidus]|uniref:alpha/beta hydrolase n=1 Tax=Rarobacter faecitabidus TaxID=13243 RepID=UPI0014772AC8|nr:alpha/beta hydrolase [Rarobacter faecitabidus]